MFFIILVSLTTVHLSTHQLTIPGGPTLEPGCTNISWWEGSLTNSDDILYNVTCTGFRSIEAIKEELKPYHYKNIRRLTISSNLFHNKIVGSDIFHGLNQTQILILSNNYITKVEDNLLEPLGPRLEALFFQEKFSLTSTMALAKFPPSFFYPLVRVTYISISTANLRKIYKNTFTKCTKLETLYLDTYRLTDLEPEALSGLLSLKLLHIKAAGQAGLSYQLLAYCPNLEVLYLSLNNHTILPENLFAGVTRLTHLEFIGSSIRLIHPKTFQPIKDTLMVLSLAANNLERLESIFPNMTNLRSLDLSFNKLSEITITTFKNLPHLRDLELGFNEITRLDPYSFVENSRLTNLNLRYNEISELNTLILKGIPELGSLYASGNRIGALENCLFQHNPKLEHLDVADNEIVMIGNNTFQGLENMLVYLDVRNNKLKANFLQSIKGLLVIKYLNISDNNITSLDPDTFANFKRLEIFQFKGNPLLCDNGMKDFVTWYENWTLSATDTDTIKERSQSLIKAKCASPRALKDVPIYHANLSLFLTGHESSDPDSVTSSLEITKSKFLSIIQTHKNMKERSVVVWILTTFFIGIFIVSFALFYMKNSRNLPSESAALSSMSNNMAIGSSPIYTRACSALNDKFFLSNIGILIKGRSGYREHDNTLSSFT